MKRKLVAIVLTIVLSVALCVGLTACDGGNKNEAYYNNSYTLAGTCTIDWDGKYYYDNYASDFSKNYSQKEIIEKHWDAIDWDRTFEEAGLNGNDVPHSTFDEFKGCFEDYEEYFYEQVAGLKISISDKSDLQLTISFPDNWMENEVVSDHYASEITMPFYETKEAFAQNKPYSGFDMETCGIGFEKGYMGAGVYKTQDNHVLVVQFSVQQFVKDISVVITDYTVDANSDDVPEPLVLFQTEFTVLNLYDTNGNKILDIRNQIDFDVAKNK